MLAIVVALASCEKHHGGLYQGGSGDGDGPSGMKLVKVSNLYYEKIYENSTLNHTYGSFSITKLNWQGNNFNSISYLEYEDGVLEEHDEGSTFVYNGGGDLAEIRYTDGSYQTTAYYTYTAGQLVEKYETWTEEDHSGWSKCTFSYANNGRLQSVTETQYDGDIYKDSLIWTGDNVTEVQHYSNGTLSRITNYTYDSKKSHYTSIPMAVLFWEDDDEYEGLSANNVILETRINSDGSSNSTSYTYTYSGDYPVKRVRNNTPDYSSSYYYVDTRTEYYEYSDGTGTSQVPQVYCITATANNSDWGFVYGSGEYAAGSTAVLYAYAWYGNNFESWNDNTTTNPRSITVNSDADYTATFSVNVNTVFSEDFESGIPSTWTNLDADGDGNYWSWSSSYGTSGGGCAYSASWTSTTQALTPDNYLVTPYVYIPNADGCQLSWDVAAQDAQYPSDYYTVYVGYLSGNSFVPTAMLWSETVTAKGSGEKTQGTWRTRSVSLNSYRGSSVRFAFRHWNCTDQFFLLLDNVQVTSYKSAGQPTENDLSAQEMQKAKGPRAHRHDRHGFLYHNREKR